MNATCTVRSWDPSPCMNGTAYYQSQQIPIYGTCKKLDRIPCNLDLHEWAWRAATGYIVVYKADGGIHESLLTLKKEEQEQKSRRAAPVERPEPTTERD